MKPDKELSLEDLQRIVPAAFVESPSPTVSKRYGFIPTFKMIGSLMQRGWRPFQALGMRAKGSKHPLFGTHMITFRQGDRPTVVGGIMPTLTLINNHLAKMKAKILGGLWRLICSNGLIVSAGISDTEVVQVHLGDAEAFIESALQAATLKIEAASVQMKDWSAAILSPVQQAQYAVAARALRDENYADYPPSDLLRVRRPEDRASDLWTTFNRVQEHLTRGGFMVNQRRARAVSAVPTLVNINQRLWNLTEQTYASL